MIEVALGAVGTLIVLWVGKTWDRNEAAKRWKLEQDAERQSWRRDRRLVAYSRCHTAAHATWRSAQRIWNNSDPSAVEALFEGMSDDVNAVATVVSEIDMVGPSEVAEAADGVQATLEAMLQMLSPHRSDEHLRGLTLVESDEGVAAQRALDVFNEAARRAIP